MITFERQAIPYFDRWRIDGFPGTLLTHTADIDAEELKSWLTSGEEFNVADAWVSLWRPIVKLTFKHKDGRMIWVAFQNEPPCGY